MYYQNIKLFVNMKQKLLILASVLTLALSAAPEASAQWVQTSAPDSGAVIGFAEIGPYFFAVINGKLFRSSDNGGTWFSTNNGLPSIGINTIVTYGSNLLAGGLGIFISSDSGLSWKNASTGIPEDTVVTAIIAKGSNLFAGTTGGVFLSSDTGRNWSPVNSGLLTFPNLSYSLYVSALAVCDSILFVAKAGGLFLSSDNGTSWKGVNSGLPDTNDEIVTAFIVNGANIFAGTYDTGVYRSTNNGTSWTDVNTGFITNTWVTSFAAKGTNIFSGTVSDLGKPGGVFLSTNNGANWKAVNEGLTDTDIWSLAIIDSNIFAGTDSGVWRRPLSQMIGTSSVAQNPSTQSESTAYPNPLTQSTTINFTSPESGAAEITIVNLLGAEVARIYSGEMDAGTHSFTWNASALPPGTYWCEIRMNGTTNQIPVVVQR